MTTERAYFGYENSLEERLRALRIYMDGKWEYPQICWEAADEIERLRSENEIAKANGERADSYFEECQRLRSLNAELAAALEMLQRQALQSDVNSPANEWGQEALDMARAALAKLKEGK